jgi:hypothetical protein
LDIAAALQGVEMSKTTMTRKAKGLIANAVIVATLVFFLIHGAQQLVVLISGLILLAAFNVLIVSKPREL